jgi:hypothetical protein
MFTGEQLYDMVTQNYPGAVLIWSGLSAEWQRAYNNAALEVLTMLVSAPTAPHTPSQIPPIQPLSEDTSWNQYYSKRPVVNEQRVKELYAINSDKNRLLKMFANLSIDELERIIKVTP